MEPAVKINRDTADWSPDASPFGGQDPGAALIGFIGEVAERE
jgi:hypothetical protein